MPDFFVRKIEQYVSDFHLDFGCGNGWFTNYLASRYEDIRIIGYDIPESLDYAKRLFKKIGMPHTDSLTQLSSIAPFDSATLTFVLHETDDPVLERVHGLLREGSYVCILDYELRGKDEQEFRNLFTAELEQEEINRLGIDEAYRIHTSKGIDECVNLGESIGFKTLEKEVMLDKYYIWVGYKS
jgi:trans-aconitate methyltransferase